MSAELGFEIDASEVYAAADTIESMPERRFMQRAADVLLREQQNRFARTVGPDGKSWKKWAPSTLAKYKRAGEPRTLMHHTLDLANSIQANVIGPDAAQVGTDVPYAKYQHYGVPSRNLPARPLIGVARGDVSRVGHRLIDYMRVAL